MTSSTERVGWAVVFLALAALGVPWFLWGSDAVAAGLPVWLWWHVGWMALAALVFRLFVRTSWGVWIEGDADAAWGVGAADEASARTEAPGDEGGERP